MGDDIHFFSNANIAVAIATEDSLYPATVYGAQFLQGLGAEIAALA